MRAAGSARAAVSASAYVPLSFAPGEAYQFDWSHEMVVMAGAAMVVKVAHVRLCHSRMMFVRAYPRESQEMVFDAHDRAFAFFRGACTRGIYDNMKTAVEAILVGRDRTYDRCFLQMCSHYLVDPVSMKASCTKGQRLRELRIRGSVPSRSWMLAGWLSSVSPGAAVSTITWRLRPLIFVPAS